MTGQGAGRSESELGTVTVELRSVNQRGLKISPRTSDALTSLEPRFEQWIRSRVPRGSIHAGATFAPAGVAGLVTLNEDAVAAYATQLRRVQDQIGGNTTIDLAMLLQLPGVTQNRGSRSMDVDSLWEMLRTATDQAIDTMDIMRLAEGDVMAKQLIVEVTFISENLGQIQTLAPRVVDGYRQRLEMKVRRALEALELDATPVDLVREVHVFADRSDINEEIVRLGGHVVMFNDTLGGEEASGRKLEFIVQEMFREINTIGSKAGDAEISSCVVDVKCALERIRELVQNIQ